MVCRLRGEKVRVERERREKERENEEAQFEGERESKKIYSRSYDMRPVRRHRRLNHLTGGPSVPGFM